MDASKKQALTAAGINVEEVLGRFMGNEALLERMLKKFLSDPTYSKLQDAADTADAEEGLRAAHTLKGLCGNLSLTALVPMFTRQVELFRAGDPAAAFAMLAQIDPVYQQICAAIRALN